MANILIVGASRGIGLELAKQYAAQGDNVIAAVRDTAAEQVQSLAAEASSVTVEALDIADPASVTAAKERIGDQPLDAVIVVAGAVGGGKQGVDDVDLAAWHEALDTNTIGPTLVASAFKANLAASGNGHLMLLSSQLAASTWPMGGMLIYSTTKAAMSKVGQVRAID